MNDVFEQFRRKITGRLLTIIEAAVRESRQRDAVMSLTRQAITQSLQELTDELRGED